MIEEFEIKEKCHLCDSWYCDCVTLASYSYAQSNKHRIIVGIEKSLSTRKLKNINIDGNYVDKSKSV